MQEIGMSAEKAQTSARSLSALKNPRIVRVSRMLGGKDRHSKVTTVRGLRDRRIRLSVPTAIQLYDLQDKLGLNQPSKAVDWLLNAAQHEIDKLPPLEMPPGGLNQYPQSIPASELGLSSASFATDNVFHDDVTEQSVMLQKSIYWNPNVLMRSKDKEYYLRELNIEKGNHSKQNDVQNEEGGLDINYGMPYNSYYHLEQSQENLSPSHMRIQFSPQAYHHFPAYMAGTSNLDQKQFSHFKMENLTTENLTPDALRISSLQTSSQNLSILQPNNDFKHHHHPEQD